MNKKWIAMLLVIVMVLTMAACGKKDNNETEAAETTGTEAEETIMDIPGLVYEPNGNPAVLDEEEDGIYPTIGSQEDPAQETTAPTTGAQEEATAPSVSTENMTEFERYNAMTGEEQMAFMNSFDSIEAFFDWYNAAKAEYDALHPNIDIGDGVIDAGDLVGRN